MSQFLCKIDVACENFLCESLARITIRKLDSFTIFGYGVETALIIAAAYAAFWKADDFLRPGFVILTGKKLQDLSVSNISIRRWTVIFLIYFQNIFGDKHFSKKCFLRSSIISLLLLFILQIFLFHILKSDTNLMAIEAILISLPPVLVFLVPINIMADFFSLLETRILLRLFAQKKRAISRGAILLFDVLLTSIIWIISTLLILVIVQIIDIAPTVREMNGFMKDIIEIWRGDDFEPLYMTKYSTLTWGNEDNFPAVIALYSAMLTTLSTSVWFYLYVISVFSLKITRSNSIFFNFFKNILPIKTKPFRSMGMIATSIVVVILIPFIFIENFLLS